MHPASKRSSRKGVQLSVGPLSVTVTVWSGVYKPESPKSYCKGSEGHAHKPEALKSRGSHCPICSSSDLPGADLLGEIVQAFKASDGSLVPIDSAASVERMINVEGLRDIMDCVAVTPGDYAAGVIESSNIYWLTPTSAADRVNYLGLVKAIQDDGLVLATVWASRSVAKLYRVGVHSDMLTLTELVHEGELRASPEDPPEADPTKVAKAAAAFALLAPTAGAEDLARLAIDPGREALRKAADKAKESGVEVIPVKRGERTTFAEKLAEADLLELLGEDVL